MAQNPGLRDARPGDAPRVTVNDPRPLHQTTIHTDSPRPRERSNRTLAFIIGGVVVGLIVLFLLFGGIFDGDRGSPGTTAPLAPVGNSTTINVEPGTAPADTTAPIGTAPAEPEPVELLEQPIPGVQTEPAPAPAD
jgi:hypothetical protein